MIDPEWRKVEEHFQQVVIENKTKLFIAPIFNVSNSLVFNIFLDSGVPGVQSMGHD